MKSIEQMMSIPKWFELNGEGYMSWGSVEIYNAAVRTEKEKYVCLKEEKKWSGWTESDMVERAGGLFGMFFKDRKKIQCILKTRQQFASQIVEEIPPILDDQAQLLGVTVRIGGNEKEIVKAAAGRFAVIGRDGFCYCLGVNVEEALVAAQLLEKTAHTFLEAKKLGGAKPINRLEAWFMQQYFLLKYSKGK